LNAIPGCAEELAVNTLPASFFLQDPVFVARHLLGMRLVRRLEGQRLGGIIIETEAYRGEDDLACHAKAGRTPRTQVMYGPPGRAYVYFTYGMHWMLNCVALPEGTPAAVLLRAIRPEEGLEQIAARRSGHPPADWCSGPGKLTQGLAVDGGLNGIDLCDSSGPLWIEEGDPVPPESVLVGPRVGIDRVPEPWKSIPWRFRVRDR
jgi:DNA-3-methyladenine glycosylase